MSDEPRFPIDVSELGPIQIWTVAFEGNRFKGEILPELERLKLAGIARIVDLLVVRKDTAGAVAVMTASDLELEEALDFGAMLGGLVGWGAGGADGSAAGALAGAIDLADGHVLDEQDVDELAAAVAPGTSAAIVLLEHLWAKPLRAAIVKAGGIELDNAWLRPDDLIAIGLASAQPEPRAE